MHSPRRSAMVQLAHLDGVTPGSQLLPSSSVSPTSKINLLHHPSLCAPSTLARIVAFHPRSLRLSSAIRRRQEFQQFSGALPRDFVKKVLSQLHRIKTLRPEAHLREFCRVLDYLSAQSTRYFKFSSYRSPGWALSGLRTLHMKEIAIIPFSNLPELLPALRRMPDLEQPTLERPSIISEMNEVSLA
jgi:hypothetical protein